MAKKKRKKAIIEPLYKNQDEGISKEQVQSFATADAIVEQPEFDQVFFPIAEMLLILGGEMAQIDPSMIQEPKEGMPSFQEMNNFDKAISETTKRILEIDNGLVQDVFVTLIELSNRLAQSGDKQLKNETDALIEFLSRKHRMEKLADLPIFRSLLLKHIRIFEEFNSELEESLNQTFEEIIEEGPADSELFEAIIDKYDERYPGFYEKMFMPDDEDETEYDEEELTEIFKEGMEAILNNEIVLNLFTKKEMEQGAKLAEDFYKKLSSRDKELIQNMSNKFSKESDFSKAVVDFLQEKITPKRLHKIILKIEKIAQKSKYPFYDDFFELFIPFLKSKNPEEAVDPILEEIFAAEARLAFENSTSIATLLYWYI